MITGQVGQVIKLHRRGCKKNGYAGYPRPVSLIRDPIDKTKAQHSENSHRKAHATCVQLSNGLAAETTEPVREWRLFQVIKIIDPRYRERAAPKHVPYNSGKRWFNGRPDSMVENARAE